MATNDFIQDIADKVAEDNIEYLLIAIQKGKEEHKANAYFNINTIDGADMILTTVDEVFRSINNDEDLPDDPDSD